MASTLLSYYASFSTTVMLGRSLVEQIIPKPILSRITTYLSRFFCFSEGTLVFEEYNEIGERNQVYDHIEHYLKSKINGQTQRIRISRTAKQKVNAFALDRYEEVADTFDNMSVKWRYVVIEPTERKVEEKRYYELIFPKKHCERVNMLYLPQVEAVAKEIENREKVLKIYTPRSNSEMRKYSFWESTIFQHSSTFDTLAMEPAEKKWVMEDLELFTKGKEFYKNVGKAWKRSYLLYGPPGTGKSSMIAAMANYLQYKIYDMELTSVADNSELRKALMSTTNRSILVIEDIDCSLDIKNRETENHDNLVDETKRKVWDKQKVTLSGMLNFVDGLWSSCGDERIFVFTTNYKDKLDPALLRPGRMDVHIHMSYCTPSGFRILARNYLKIQESNPHYLFGEIEEMIRSMEITPAQVAGKLELSRDADVSLAGLVDFLKKTKEEKRKEEEEAEKKKKVVEAEAKKPIKKLVRFFKSKREIT